MAAFIAQGQTRLYEVATRVSRPLAGGPVFKGAPARWTLDSSRVLIGNEAYDAP